MAKRKETIERERIEKIGSRLAQVVMRLYIVHNGKDRQGQIALENGAFPQDMGNATWTRIAYALLAEGWRAPEEE